jgi:hypothetical protein
MFAPRQATSYAAALPAGVKIGPRGKFHKRAVAVRAEGNSHSTRGGPWKKAHSRYLGLKFWVKGKTTSVEHA